MQANPAQSGHPGTRAPNLRVEQCRRCRHCHCNTHVEFVPVSTSALRHRLAVATWFLSPVPAQSESWNIPVKSSGEMAVPPTWRFRPELPEAAGGIISRPTVI